MVRKPKDLRGRHDEETAIGIIPFNELVGAEIMEFIVGNVPRKVLNRISNAARHYTLAAKLEKIDEEMGAIRLIAAEEELVVAVFEWIKLNEKYYPEHRQFVRLFKNHIVKLAFYPVLAQFRWVLEDMLSEGFSLEGLDGLIHWTAKPIVDGKEVKLALYDDKNKEIIRTNPLAVGISRQDIHGKEVVPLLLADLAETIMGQTGFTLREFLTNRADYRNQIMYATDGGIMAMGETLAELTVVFKRTYHDLLWVIALLVGSKPPSKEWGLVSQFVGMYHSALIEAKVLRPNEGESKLPV